MKYLNTAKALEARIRRGDYFLKKLPVEQELMTEFNVSRVTVRKAILTLIEQGVLARRANMSIEVADHEKMRRKYMAFLAPAFRCSGIQADLARLEHAALRYGVTIRVVDYVDWHDPMIREALNTFPGVFFVPLPTRIPAEVEALLRSARAKVVGVDCDLTGLGFPSLNGNRGADLFRLLNYLTTLGHQRIWCLNTQPLDPEIEHCLMRWEQWVALQPPSCATRLLQEPVPPYGLNWVRAYEVMTRELEAGNFDATALFCTTLATAVGATRALHEHGRQSGADVAICSACDDGIARFLCPSITCFVAPPDLGAFLERCVEWMLSEEAAWDGPLSFQSGHDTLFRGESTGPAAGSETAGRDWEGVKANRSGWN